MERRKGDGLTMAKVLGYGLVGATLVGMVWAGNYSKSRRDEAYSSGQRQAAASQPQPAYASSKPETPSMPPRVELYINTPVFKEYQSRLENMYNDFKLSRRINTSMLPLRESMELSRILGAGFEVGLFVFDANNDGINEILLRTCDRGVGCRGSVHKLSDTGRYAKILDVPIDKISDRTINGFPVVYSQKYGSRDIYVEYSSNGQWLEESGKIIMPESLDNAARTINSYLVGGNSSGTSEYLRHLQESIGADYALRTFLHAQAPPGFTMPTGSEYVEYVRQWAMEIERTNPGMGERALTRYADDPKGFYAAVFGRSMEPAFLDVLNPKSIVGVSLAVTRSLGRSGDWERHMEYWDSAQNRIGFLAAHKNATGNYPQSESDLWSAMNNAVREDKLRVTQGMQGRNPAYRQEPPRGTQTFTSDGITGDPRYQQWQPQDPSVQERASQMDRETQQGAERARQASNQAAERARQMKNQIENQLGNILGQKEQDK